MHAFAFIRIVAGLIFLCIALIVGILYMLFLSRVLGKCAPSSRTMQPPMVWLLLIPLFSLVWEFIVVNAIADTLSNEFRLRGITPNNPGFGRSLGIAMAVCAVGACIPLLNVLALPASLVLWIVYWTTINGYSRQLDQSPPVLPA